MYTYKITFFKFVVTEQDWKKFFAEIIHLTSAIDFYIWKNGQRLEFYIKARNKVDSLNPKLYPFNLDHELTEQEQLRFADTSISHQVIFPLFINSDLITFIGDKASHWVDISMLHFRISKFSIRREHPKVDLTYRRGESSYSASTIMFMPISQLLAFDLSNTINIEVPKVMPKLIGNDVMLNYSTDGILHLPSLDNSQSYISTSAYDYWRHSLILGQSGSGKSVLLKLIIEDLVRKSNDTTVVLIDPHASVEPTLNLNQQSVSINFQTTKTNLFVNTGQTLVSSELTLDLFSHYLDLQNNQQLNRVLKFAVQTLYSINAMDFNHMKSLLVDIVARKEILQSVPDDHLRNFFETEYQEIYTTQYANAVLPIINLISEFSFIDQVDKSYDLNQVINNNFLVSVAINQSKLGKNITRLLGGAIVQQIFSLIQSGKISKKVILMIDEFAVIQSNVLSQVLSEARKFGLTIILSQQYLTQVNDQILKSIFSNTVNYYCFKLDRQDAEIMAKIMNCSIDSYFLVNKNNPQESLEMSINLFTQLNPREVISRIMVNNQYTKPFKAITKRIQFSRKG